jgi:hypothetical protein
MKVKTKVKAGATDFTIDATHDISVKGPTLSSTLTKI